MGHECQITSIHRTLPPTRRNMTRSLRINRRKYGTKASEYKATGRKRVDQKKSKLATSTKNLVPQRTTATTSAQPRRLGIQQHGVSSRRRNMMRTKKNNKGQKRLEKKKVAKDQKKEGKAHNPKKKTRKIEDKKNRNKSTTRPTQKKNRSGTPPARGGTRSRARGGKRAKTSGKEKRTEIRAVRDPRAAELPRAGGKKGKNTGKTMKKERKKEQK